MVGAKAGKEYGGGQPVISAIIETNKLLRIFLLNDPVGSCPFRRIEPAPPSIHHPDISVGFDGKGGGQGSP